MKPALWISLAVAVVVAYGTGALSYKNNYFPLKQLRELRQKPNTISQEHVVQGKELLKTLRSGGNTIYIRHAHRERMPNKTEIDLASLARGNHLNPKFERGVCLSKAGRAQSEFLHYAFKQLEIPIGEVLSSPLCRCVETAKITTKKKVEVRKELTYSKAVEKEHIDEHIKLRRALMEETPKPGKNRLVFAHSFSVLAEIGLPVDIGEAQAAIFRTNENKEIQLVGFVTLDTWGGLLLLQKSDPNNNSNVI